MLAGIEATHDLPRGSPGSDGSTRKPQQRPSAAPRFITLEANGFAHTIEWRPSAPTTQVGAGFSRVLCPRPSPRHGPWTLGPAFLDQALRLGLHHQGEARRNAFAMAGEEIGREIPLRHHRDGRAPAPADAVRSAICTRVSPKKPAKREEACDAATSGNRRAGRGSCNHGQGRRGGTGCRPRKVAQESSRCFFQHHNAHARPAPKQETPASCPRGPTADDAAPGSQGR